jgi:hypothetical protein
MEDNFSYHKIIPYKYQLLKDYSYKLTIGKEFKTTFKTPFIELVFFTPIDKYLIIKKGYAWDGASGGCIDTKTVMRGSLVHDALYQCIRLGLLERKKYKPIADNVFYNICLEDGMNKFRAGYVYQAVRIFGYFSTLPKKNENIINY